MECSGSIKIDTAEKIFYCAIAFVHGFKQFFGDRFFDNSEILCKTCVQTLRTNSHTVDKRVYLSVFCRRFI